ncbi:MAG: hypothetical protein IT316_02360 [Anaerolineales bacterium]|nr:hypothetical protein [Anaerolineales bacterium]
MVGSSKRELVARLTGRQGSGNFFSLAQANALLLIPSGVKSLPFDGQAEAWLIDDFEKRLSLGIHRR